LRHGCGQHEKDLPKFGGIYKGSKGGMVKKKSSSEKAYDQLQKAQQQKMVSDIAEETTGERDHMLDRNSNMMEQRAVSKMSETHEVATIPGKEIAPFKETVEHPKLANIQASHDRQQLISNSNCFDMAIDAAETIGATNSLEKMLAHQMAACHNAGMNLIQKINYAIDDIGNHKDDDLRLQRMTNTATKLMTTFQQGMKTIQQTRSGGEQKMTVEHVHVHDGGQAVVGNVQGGPGVKGVGNEK